MPPTPVRRADEACDAAAAGVTGAAGRRAALAARCARQTRPQNARPTASSALASSHSSLRMTPTVCNPRESSSSGHCKLCWNCHMSQSTTQKKPLPRHGAVHAQRQPWSRYPAMAPPLGRVRPAQNSSPTDAALHSCNVSGTRKRGCKRDVAGRGCWTLPDLTLIRLRKCSRCGRVCGRKLYDLRLGGVRDLNASGAAIWHSTTPPRSVLDDGSMTIA